MIAEEVLSGSSRHEPWGTPVLEAVSVYRSFHAGGDDVLALNGVSVSLDRGEFVAVAGPSGSGKSTLLAVIAGLDDPSGGVVRVCGSQMSGGSPGERAAVRRHHVGYLGQSSTLIGHLTVAQNVRLVRCLAGATVPGSDQVTRAGIAERRNALPRDLSAGETARAGLAVALANDPCLLLADEPSGELDRADEDRLLHLLRGLSAQGLAVMVATHSPAVIAAADRVLRLADGHEVAG